MMLDLCVFKDKRRRSLLIQHSSHASKHATARLLSGHQLSAVLSQPSSESTDSDGGRGALTSYSCMSASFENH